jgi:two-component system OmpR family sensor kinase
LALYLSSTILLISTFAYSYYQYKKEELIKQQHDTLTQNAHKILNEIVTFHKNQQASITYPRYDDFKSALFDIDQNLIFSTVSSKRLQAFQNKDFKSEFSIKGHYAYYILEVYPYYLGTKYILIEQKLLTPVTQIKKNILAMALFALILVILTSLFLVKLILKPIRSNLELLDRFIKDTAHELNTPISTILTNIEMLEQNANIMEPKFEKKINRIKIGARTISNLYQDLTYLTLNHKKSVQNQTLALSPILKDRIEYFRLSAESKKITFETDIGENIHIFADKNNMERLFDNLLSNAVKYSKKSTTVNITLGQNFFEIEDRGKGMTSEQIKTIFERYSRFDNTVGGFGIGYNIIESIIKEHSIDIQIDSVPDQGTKVTLKWTN